VFRVDRGGDITYHGPGQLVGYPILSLGEAPDVVAYVRALEDGLRAALADFGIASRTVDGKTGVWVTLPDRRDAKVAAIGVRVSRGITRHGFALNVDPDLAAFERMIPCGFMHEVASFARLGVSATIAEAARACATRLGERLGRAIVWDAEVPSPRDDEIAPEAPVRRAEDLLAAAAA
jgi:lipoyl(octanoyl) transferase